MAFCHMGDMRTTKKKIIQVLRLVVTAIEIEFDFAEIEET